MHRRIIISLCLALMSFSAGYAMPSTQVPDTLDMMLDTAMFAEPVVKDSVKIWDKGFDVKNYLNTVRSKAPTYTQFNNENFFSNVFVGVRGSSVKLINSDYCFGQVAGLVLGKWFHTAAAVRLGMSIPPLPKEPLAYWYDNFDARRIRAFEMSADVMFNLMSYLYGYDTRRFCELSVFGGIDYVHVWKPSADPAKKADKGDAFSLHAGVNVDMRVFDRLHLFIEPQVNLYFNPRQGASNKGIAISSAGDWKSYSTAFRTTVGLAYNFGQTKPDTKRLSGSYRDPDLDWNGYFISALAGLQFQLNSSLVWRRNMKAGERVGKHFAFGGGRWYNEYFGLRLSASYAENPWVKYLNSKPLATQYISMRLEGMLDVLNMYRYFWDDSKGLSSDIGSMFGLSLILGPEMGRMSKKDINNSLIRAYYVGATVGIQGRCQFHKWVTAVLEPRVSFVPYTAPHADIAAPSDNMNYCDVLFNLNIGLEVRIPAWHKPSKQK